MWEGGGSRQRPKYRYTVSYHIIHKIYIIFIRIYLRLFLMSPIMIFKLSEVRDITNFLLVMDNYFENTMKQVWIHNKASSALRRKLLGLRPHGYGFSHFSSSFPGRKIHCIFPEKLLEKWENPDSSVFQSNSPSFFYSWLSSFCYSEFSVEEKYSNFLGKAYSIVTASPSPRMFSWKQASKHPVKRSQNCWMSFGVQWHRQPNGLNNATVVL